MEFASSTCTPLELSRPSGEESVVATRRWPSCSDSEYWFSRRPGTLPEAAYAGAPGRVMSNRCTSVSSGGGPCVLVGGTPGVGSSGDGSVAGASSSTGIGSIGHHQRGLLATYRLRPVP